ncbi:PREDICTED: lipoxygenase 2, chloroplastic [Tarenaya hassleriana]|uniref:lipoxygenase 2, chloroplastic n=1 Tax=Tarenaya hassleriana TaxID=28532 RepID=UPI00053C6DFB|nr:PREDICTED: lipoxygenase 2, chloroplastic [Tarenaya hassleriana]
MLSRESSLHVLDSSRSLSFLLHRPSILLNRNHNVPVAFGRQRNLGFRGIRASSSPGSNARKEKEKTTGKTVKVKGFITAKEGLLEGFSLSRSIDDITDLRGRSLLVELVSSETEPGTGFAKENVKDYAQRVWSELREEKYECVFDFPEDFGPVGAILVQNQHRREIFLREVVLELPTGPVTFTCNSWVCSKFDDPTKRVFFSNKSYLPSQTPEPLKNLRKSELENLQGVNRQEEGEFKVFERIYDYDVYNDLGDPDEKPDNERPVLGGNQFLPYPRRCKTGRKRCESDRNTEKRYGSFYVPRDEEFRPVKEAAFAGNAVLAVLPSIFPQIESALVDPDMEFPHFKAIDDLFDEGIELPKNEGLLSFIPNLIKVVAEATDDVLQFTAPVLVDRDRFSWIRDEEFARQTLAGLNPYCIQLVKEWPLTSKLDPEEYGPPESLITSELVEKEIKGFMTFQEALENNRLFILDYHDLFLPFVHQVRQIEGTTLYGSRTLFFLNDDSTLRPIAIELTRPKDVNRPQWKQVFTPGYDATSCWLWRLAKAHVCAHDAGYHQLIVHWLRTHCCMEPYIIAANRKLSAMHPIYRLLCPHFRYTMEINARARQSLINANGIIETSFWPGKYSMEISSIVYGKLWRFDMESLPGDLIRRGLAVEDETAEHGLRLAIQDYPFANDGLILWDAIKEWVTEYVNHYYPDAATIQSDEELQGWWSEVREVGHGDKKDEPWWPVLKTQDDLINVVTTIAWVGSGHHAAVNFGQYGYGGYFPNRPTTARRKIPTEEPTEEEFKEFIEDPEKLLLKTYPSQKQATQVMVTLDLLSSHSPDEEYIGEIVEPAWEEEPVIYAAFERFKGRLQYLEGVIDERNVNLNLKNRAGAGVVKYELLKPTSDPGVTGKGVPYSISI